MKKWVTSHCCCCTNKAEKAVDLEFERKDQERPVSVYDIVSAGVNGGEKNGGGVVNKAYDDSVIVKQPAIVNGQTKIVDTYPNLPGGDTNEALLTPPPPPEGKSLSDLVFEELDRSQNLATSSRHQGTSFFSVPDAVDPPLPKKEDRRKPKSPPPPPPQEDNADIFAASLDRVSADLPPDDQEEEVVVPVVDVSAICKGGISVETGEKCTRSQMKKFAAAETGEVLAVDEARNVAQEEPQQQQQQESIENEEEVGAEQLEPQQDQPQQEVREEPVELEPQQEQEMVEEPTTQQQHEEVAVDEPKQSEENEEQKQTEAETTATTTPKGQQQEEEEDDSRIIQEASSRMDLQVDDEDSTTKQATTVWRDRLARELLDDDIEFEFSSSSADDDEETSVTSQSSPQQRRRGVALVIDNGSWEVRSGFSGKFSPQRRTRNVIGRWKSETGEAWRAQHGSRFYGDDAIQKHSTLTLHNLMKDGVVCDWKDMMGMWSYIIEEELDSDVTQHPVVVSEPVGVDRRERERMLEILIESMRAPGVLLRSQAQLSLYSQQAESGLVVNCGHSGTQIAPIYQGYQLNYGCLFLDVGGQQITDQLSRLVQQERGITFASVGEMEAINSIKENYAYVAADDEEKHHSEKHEILLPDGRAMELDKELWMCTEVIFQPDLIGSSSPGLHQLIIDSIKKLPTNTLRNARGEIDVILAGGTGTKLDGLAERLQSEVENLMTSTSDDVITVRVANCGPDAAWIGGSLLADQDADFDRLLVNNKSYLEYGGSKVVHQMF